MEHKNNSIIKQYCKGKVIQITTKKRREKSLEKCVLKRTYDVSTDRYKVNNKEENQHVKRSKQEINITNRSIITQTEDVWLPEVTIKKMYNSIQTQTESCQFEKININLLEEINKLKEDLEEKKLQNSLLEQQFDLMSWTPNKDNKPHSTEQSIAEQDNIVASSSNETNRSNETRTHVLGMQEETLDYEW